MNVITIQAKVRFNNDHTADVILSLEHPVHLRVIPLIGKTYQLIFLYRADADVYILSHYRLIPIILCIPRKMF